MRYIYCEQGSAEWKRARAGVITASNFHLTRSWNLMKRAPRVGDYSDKAKDYAFRLAIERISGEPLDEGYETWAMERGHRMEPKAREEHEVQAGVLVDTVGFVTTDDGVFGGSLDGEIGPDGASEYKAFVAPEKLRAIIIYSDWSTLMDQAQGGLWLTGRKWIDACLYCPALAPAGKQLTRRRIQRDDDYIYDLEQDLLKFKAVVDSYEAVLRAPTGEQPVEVAAKVVRPSPVLAAPAAFTPKASPVLAGLPF
jgi:hypothetical protein